MPKRAIRLVKQIGAVPCVAGCSYCSKQIKASAADLRSAQTATKSLQAQFDAHKCEREDASQAAARIVKEATERD